MKNSNFQLDVKMVKIFNYVKINFSFFTPPKVGVMVILINPHSLDQVKFNGRKSEARND